MREILAKRYGKALIVVILVILGSFAMQTTSVIRGWHSNQEWLHSAKFKQIFEAHPENYANQDYAADETEIKTEYTLEEYIEKESYLFANRYAVNSQGKIQDVNNAYLRYGNSAFYVAMGLVALCGFLMFFVDQKTGFNRYLFSLAISRKRLFWSKILYLAVPLLIAFVLGIALMIAGFSLGIPAPYLNVSLGQLIASGFLGTVTCIFFLAISCFMGSMLGNLVMGPLSYVIFMWMLQLLPSMLAEIYELIYYLLYHESTPEKGNAFVSYGTANLFVFRLGANQIYWPGVLGMLAVSGGILFWAYRKYQTLSLEKDGDYLLHSESRFPVWLIAVCYLTCFAVFGLTQVWSAYLYGQLYPATDWGTSLQQGIVATIFWVVVAMVISTLLLYFAPLRKLLREKWGQRKQLLGKE